MFIKEMFQEHGLDLDYQKYRSKVFDPLLPTKGHIPD